MISLLDRFVELEKDTLGSGPYKSRHAHHVKYINDIHDFDRHQGIYNTTSSLTIEMKRISPWFSRDYLGEEKSSMFLSGRIKCFGTWYTNGYVEEIYDLCEDLKRCVGSSGRHDENVFWFTSEYDTKDHKERIIISVVKLLIEEHVILARVAALAINRKDSVFINHLYKAFT